MKRRKRSILLGCGLAILPVALLAGLMPQPCVVKMDVKAEIWKATKSILIVTDWTS